MRILFVCPYSPSLIRFRSYNFIKALWRQGHDISLLCLVHDKGELENTEQLRQYCESVKTVHLSPYRSLVNCLLYAPSSVALQSAYCFSGTFSTAVRSTLDNQRFDIVHVEHIRAAYALPDGTRSIPAVFDSVDCISSLYRQFAHDRPSRIGKLIAALEARKLVHYEPDQASRFDRVVVTSENEKSELKRLAPYLNIDVVPCGVDLEYFDKTDGLGKRGEIVLSGKMSYYANEAAARFFCSDVFPLIVSREPRATLTIVGSSPSKLVQRYGRAAGVTVTGHVPDIRPYVRSARVAVCPITVGAGIQTKVLEAMAIGRPVVATSKACRALSVTNGEHLLIADKPQEFADAVVRLIRDDGLAETLGRNGREYVETHHNWDDKARQLVETYQKAGASACSS
jgi:sugar transferase (PEP-CTERM/EpsH1 system associated)